MRIKCPLCQSSAITMVWEDTDNYSNTHTKEYECKCGCAFEVNFTATNTKFLHIPIDKINKV